MTAQPTLLFSALAQLSDHCRLLAHVLNFPQSGFRITSQWRVGTISNYKLNLAHADGRDYIVLIKTPEQWECGWATERDGHHTTSHLTLPVTDVSVEQKLNAWVIRRFTSNFKDDCDADQHQPARRCIGP